METIGTDPSTQSAIDIVQQHVFFRPTNGQGWQSKPELPTAAEILAKRSDINQLPENPVDVPWSSKDDYLTALYEILRREAIEGLRFSVRSYADHRRKDSMMDDDFTNIYTQVRVKEYVMSTVGPLTRVSFSTERSKYRILWKQSKRLQPGKIVALSPKGDNFRRICKIATIAQRPYSDGLDQDPPVVDLLWANPEDAVLDPSLDMVMLESLHGYFESARHSLTGLQHAARTNSPLDKYLTGAHTEDSHPAFLKEDPIIDLSTLASRATPDDAEAVAELKEYDIINGELPDLKDLTLLDESQLQGLHRVVSKELAIVQGPPGTGKTYTSVEAIRVLVANRRKHPGPPILVAAQTNHALDQILVHCIKSGANVLRMGGRTQNELIKPRTLFELRQNCSRSQIPADSKCRPIDDQRKTNARKIQELVDALFSDGLLDPQALLDFGIITPAQHKSLCDESMETHQAMDVHGPFALWLGDSLIPAKIREDRHPTQLELNEAEVRKNLPEFECDDDEELENIADDDEDRIRFRGTVIPLKHVWSGKDPANLTSWDRAVARALRNEDLFSIERDLRGAVYQHFQAKLLDAMAPQFAALLAENINLCKKRKAFKFLGNTQLVDKQRIDIVGCTTTGLTKYRGCLAAMQPQSLLIEEAAETREANIVSALYPSIQQLILVGDHKQLAPKCDIQRLGDPPYNINVSLFQRMVNLNMQFVMLKQQRRMKPELRHILKPFYPELYDHPSVQSINHRPDVLGMGGRNLWLFDHTWPEDVNSDFSKFNEQEAEMITNFFAYLVANGTPAEKITVLTFYKGQRKVLLRKLKRNPSIMGSTFNVCTIDSYQGEENDIILLSLVRSPQVDRSYAVGFLEDERRAVVAISRARRGFYVFGNVDNVLHARQESYDLWYKICYGFAEQGRIERERGLPLVCQPHAREIWIKEVDDWGDNSGGCDLPCRQTRPCGHRCTLKCHAIAHEDLPCSEPCREKLECGHGCQRLCGQKCFCDCKTFAEINRQAQAAKQHLSLEDKMKLMGAEETEMLKASLNNRNASRQQAQPAPALPVPGQAGFSRGGRNNGRPAQQSRPIPARTTHTAAEWGRFVENIEQHDEQLLQERLANAEEQQVSEQVIHEVYQPTTLENGQRVGGGARTVQQVQQVQKTYNKAAAVSVNGQTAVVSGLQNGVANLGLTNGSQAKNGLPADARRVNKLSMFNTLGNQPGRVMLNHRGRGGKAGRKSPTKPAGRGHNFPVQHPSVQQRTVQQPTIQQPTVHHPPVEHAPVQPPPTQTNLPTDGVLIDTSPVDASEGRHPPLPGYKITPHLLNQFGSLTPSPATSMGSSSVFSEAVQSGLATSTPAPAQTQVPAQAQAQAQAQPNSEEKNGVEDEEDDWLIEL